MSYVEKAYAKQQRRDAERRATQRHLVPPDEVYGFDALPKWVVCHPAERCNNSYQCEACCAAINETWKAVAIERARAEGKSIATWSHPRHHHTQQCDVPPLVIVAPPPVVTLPPATIAEAIEQSLRTEDDRLIEWIADGKPDLLSEHGAGAASSELYAPGDTAGWLGRCLAHLASWFRGRRLDARVRVLQGM